MKFAIMWFGIGTFVAIVNFTQWCFDGCLIGEGPEDRFYYLSGMLQNVFFGFVFGPILLVIQITQGMPILPQKHTLASKTSRRSE